MNIKFVKNFNQICPERPTLFCFPFAGGGASAYNSWIQKMQGKITVCPIQLPGREERIMEKPYSNMVDMLDELEESIWESIKGSYAFWGHSMGGKIAYELERRMEKRGKTAQCFLVSGSRIPSIPEPNPIYHLPDDEFKKALGRFEGTPKEILENQELMDFFLPMLRADFTMDETYYDTEIAEELYRSGIRNEPVAITLPRGYEQIMAIMGVLLSGNMYVPVSGSQPKERRKLIHEKTGVRYVITNNEWKKVIEWPNETKLFLVEEMKKSEKVELPVVSPSDSAYIIMTSGSTGVPKGVEIAHASAWNTIQDINKKYQVSEQDIGLAVSAIDFDLSLYDIFGILGVGGTLVLLPEKERRNAEYWLNQIKRYHVTIWNSVPVLLDMLCICAETQKEKLPLRVVMLSGDWIGMDLPERVATLTDSCKFVAMGGATEASIWSNYQNVTLPLPMEWKSIPYGRPLEHQSYRVVDEYGRDCPYWAEEVVCTVSVM